jgi:hypothetical protein
MKKNGRPESSVNFPQGLEFTVKEVADQNPTVNPVTIQLKINKCLESGTIKFIKSIPSGKGRPKKVFKLV